MNSKRVRDVERHRRWLSGKSSEDQGSYRWMQREKKLRGSGGINPLRERETLRMEGAGEANQHYDRPS
jgi:hypothetical protein